MKKIVYCILILGTLYLGFYPIPIDPIARTPPPFPGLEGDFSSNSKLASTQLVQLISPGGESIVQDSLGYFYSGLANGDIIRFNPTGEDQKVIANTGGRPLGMKIAPSGELIIADQKKGLLRLDSLHKIHILVDQYKGEKLLFVDDLDITKEGIIYFSNATQRNPEIVENEAWEQRASGALFSYDLASKETVLLKDHLFFPNGVALDDSEMYFLFSETLGLTLKKYWIKGTKKGTVELFTNKLPGFPDNITFEKGVFWVAIPSQRPVEFEKMYEYPFLRSIIFRLPEAIKNAVIPNRYAMLLGYNTGGEVIYNLQDPNGKYDYITSVLQVDNKLYLGSLKEPYVGIYTLENEISASSKDKK